MLAFLTALAPDNDAGLVVLLHLYTTVLAFVVAAGYDIAPTASQLLFAGVAGVIAPGLYLVSIAPRSPSTNSAPAGGQSADASRFELLSRPILPRGEDLPEDQALRLFERMSLLGIAVLAVAGIWFHGAGP
ncbi:hypothetical protein [Cryptosporangium sp. NPDC051539]|uniref:hypothetical protein n=1 Tax=Cryptosporangium sp. NPDC051539 TaxID=3363962 RepID=UPI0037BDA010